MASRLQRHKARKQRQRLAMQAYFEEKGLDKLIDWDLLMSPPREMTGNVTIVGFDNLHRFRIIDGKRSMRPHTIYTKTKTFSNSSEFATFFHSLLSDTDYKIKLWMFISTYIHHLDEILHQDCDKTFCKDNILAISDFLDTYGRQISEKISANLNEDQILLKLLFEYPAGKHSFFATDPKNIYPFFDESRGHGFGEPIYIGAFLGEPDMELVKSNASKYLPHIPCDAFAGSHDSDSDDELDR